MFVLFPSWLGLRCDLRPYSARRDTILKPSQNKPFLKWLLSVVSPQPRGKSSMYLYSLQQILRNLPRIVSRVMLINWSVEWLSCCMNRERDCFSALTAPSVTPLWVSRGSICYCWLCIPNGIFPRVRQPHNLLKARLLRGKREHGMLGKCMAAGISLGKLFIVQIFHFLL